MEELKLLIGMVEDLPQMALWVIALFFFYKVAIVGSIYGVIRLGINRLHGWAVKPKHELVETDYTTKIDRLTINGEAPALISQLERIVGINTSIDTNYIHSSDISWLRDAITEKIERDKKES